jgi:hypothetical protein
LPRWNVLGPAFLLSATSCLGILIVSIVLVVVNNLSLLCSCSTVLCFFFSSCRLMNRQGSCNALVVPLQPATNTQGLFDICINAPLVSNLQIIASHLLQQLAGALLTTVQEY